MPPKRRRTKSELAEEGEEANGNGTAAEGDEARVPMTAEEREEADRMEKIARRAEERAAARAAAAAAANLGSSETVAHAAPQASSSFSSAPGPVAAAADASEEPAADSGIISTVKPVFLSKAERQAAALARLAEQRASKDTRSNDMENAHERFAKGVAQQERMRQERQQKADEEREKMLRQTEDKKDVKERSSELRAIQEQYLGGGDNEITRHMRAKVDIKKGGKTFKMEWDATDDTTRRDFNPLYNQRFNASVLFGRGTVGGVDPREQKTLSFLNALGEKRQAELREAERNNSELTEADKRKREQQRGDAARAMRRSQAQTEAAADKEVARAAGSHWTEKPLEQLTERDWRIMREDFDIRVQGGHPVAPLRNWAEAKIPEPIMRAINSLGYKEPSPIQRQAIPVGLARRDIIGIAETGSGKTCAFLVPLLSYILNLPKEQTSMHSVEENGPLGVIMAPTRELAAQIDEEAVKLSKFTQFVQSVCIVGGQDIEAQGVKLRKGVHIVVGTPGRLVDCIASNYLVLNQCNYIVLDEADRMVDMGFEEALLTVMDAMSGSLKSEDEEQALAQAEQAKNGLAVVRVTAMFSATMSTEVERIAKRYLRHPAIIKIGDQDSGKNRRIEQRILWMPEGQKRSKINDILRSLGKSDKGIVFVNAKKQADSVGWGLEQAGFQIGILHGGRSQSEREATLEQFRRGQYKVLVATDVAARGLDIPDVSHVINYDCPLKIENYSHRIGRTGRAGKSGISITFLTDNDADVMYDLKAYLESTDSVIPDQLKRHQAAQQPVGTRNEAGKLVGEKRPFENK